MLTLDRVKKFYDRSLILDIPSLALDPNTYWVKGENGSGKSTFLRMVAGLLPFEGEIHIYHTGLNSQPSAYRRQVSWADAEPLFPAFVTGLELLQFYQKIRKASATQTAQLTGVLGLEKFIHLKTGSYSSGTLKKLSLLLAFLGNPAVILLDEPLITLDAGSVTNVCELVNERRASGSLVLLSSHLEHDELVSSSDKQLLVSNHTIQFT